MGGLTFDLALSGTIGAAAGLIIAIRAYLLAKDAYAVAVGHALDRTGHRGPIPLRPADPPEAEAEGEGPTRM